MANLLSWRGVAEASETTGLENGVATKTGAGPHPARSRKQAINRKIHFLWNTQETSSRSNMAFYYGKSEYQVNPPSSVW
jgi:hypothetical protein